jgi:hypothetical protein
MSEPTGGLFHPANPLDNGPFIEGAPVADCTGQMPSVVIGSNMGGDGMTSIPRTVRHLVGGLYAWSVAVFFGAVLLDVVYSKLLDKASESVAQSVYGEVSDFLLILGAFSIIAALAAIGFSWSNRSATYLLASSLAVLLSEFLGPIVLFPLVRTLPDSSILAIGPLFRLVPIALASLLALSALRASFRQTLSLSN